MRGWEEEEGQRWLTAGAISPHWCEVGDLTFVCCSLAGRHMACESPSGEIGFPEIDGASGTCVKVRGTI